MGRSRGGMTSKIYVVVDKTAFLSVWASQQAKPMTTGSPSNSCPV